MEIRDHRPREYYRTSCAGVWPFRGHEVISVHQTKVCLIGIGNAQVSFVVWLVGRIVLDKFLDAISNKRHVAICILRAGQWAIDFIERHLPLLTFHLCGILPDLCGDSLLLQVVVLIVVSAACVILREEPWPLFHAGGPTVEIVHKEILVSRVAVCNPIIFLYLVQYKCVLGKQNVIA